MEIYFVLVEPGVPENVGAAARAIKTMGFTKLILVKPCDHLSSGARKLAHGSVDILENAIVHKNIADALAQMDLVIASTARYRVAKEDYMDAGGLKSFLEMRYNTYKNVAMVFGREESGLSNAELSCCDITTTVPMASSYPSLNLAQAVMIYAYILADAVSAISSTGKDVSPLNLGSLRSKIDSLLSGTKIEKNETLRGRIMERLALASDNDLRLIHSVCNSLTAKYEKNKQ